MDSVNSVRNRLPSLFTRTTVNMPPIMDRNTENALKCIVIDTCIHINYELPQKIMLTISIIALFNCLATCKSQCLFCSTNFENIRMFFIFFINQMSGFPSKKNFPFKTTRSANTFFTSLIYVYN